MTTGKITPHNGNWYILVAALLPPAQPLTLAPGISIRKLPCLISLLDLAEAGKVGFTAWAALQPFSKYLFAEIESAKDADTSPGYNTLDRAWLVTALLVLRGFTPLRNVACSGYSWANIAGSYKRFSASKTVENRPQLPPFNGTLMDFHFKSIVDLTPRLEEVTLADAAWIQQHFDSFNRLASESEKFRFALEAAVDWRFAKEPRSAVARIWSGIEALCGINTELTYRLSLISASLLAPRGSERKTKFDSVKTLYGLRSKVVHGEQLEKDKILEVASDSFHLLKDLLMVSIKRGRTLTQNDIDDAIFY